ncbi:RusA family crossover junction endodeoxyribonuclease [Turicibacter sanguinis]|uniref:RusA family crossover junction endodeoxyribonuclease n=1 Tax=Turicibacter sanguinis TaxID=154288 RepID=UPI0018AA1EF0|nr:RusA family crossover junction endodeoxyribonuclease [Turicibacter sanguinis]MDB8554089.1 RusA family crossover junction endodeoxyribonuclease [Turicibacter sanguinis]
MRVFKIPGKVQAKQRPRLSKGRIYTPQPTVNYENYVKWCYSDYANQYGLKPIQGAIKAEIEVFMPIAKSDSKKKKEAKLSGKIRPTVKPDNDNIAKSVLDALNGLAYVDDKQIVDLKVDKYYGVEPYVNVKLVELEGDIHDGY